jgi:predicted Zn finger-like uncharacterized protein
MEGRALLITTCTHCLARFRVTPQQLNSRQGQVRCGKCGQVFSGFEALERVPDDDTGTRLLAAREALERKPPQPQPAPPEDLPELETVEPPAASPVPARSAARTAAGAPPSAGPPSGTLPPARAERAQEAEALAEPLELTPPRQPVARAWSFGVVLLLVVLAAEGAYAFRTPLAERYPVLRPWLESACARIGCAVHWSRDEHLLKLEDSQLLEVPGRPDQIALAARIRNLASFAQEYPDLELTLTDIGGQPAARRVLRPADYLGHALAPDNVLAAGAEVAIQLRLETAGLKPTGYELLVFYP